MSDMMTRAVIMMPLDIAMSSDLSRRQFHSRAQDVLKERDTYRELCGELLEALKNSSAAAHMHTANQVCCGQVGQQCCGEPDVDWPAWAKQLMDDNHGFITKAEAILGGNNGTSN